MRFKPRYSAVVEPRLNQHTCERDITAAILEVHVYCIAASECRKLK